MRAYKEGMTLREPRFMDFVEEFDSPWSVTMSTIWPNLIVQREMNTLGVRQIVPTGPHEFIMKWTMFGFEGDDEEMTRHRLRQGNLMGPAGFLGLEDNEAIKFVQDGMQQRAGRRASGEARSRNAGRNRRYADFGVRHPRHVQALARGDGPLGTISMQAPQARPLNDRRIEALLLHHEIETFNAAYAAALDEQRLADWAEMFTDDAFYVVMSRENADRGMPVGLIYCERQGHDPRPRLRGGKDRDVCAALSAPHHRQHSGARRGTATATSARAPIMWCCRCCSTGRTQRCIRSASITTCFAAPTRD